MTNFCLQGVLFDLDGTLVDTAADLMACLNRSLQAYGFAAVDEQLLRPQISLGALAMIRQAVPTADIELQQRIQDSMLDFYEQNIAEYSRCYQGMAEVLQTIEQLGLKWGVVTNKKQRFTQPLLAALQLSERAACAISGDSTPYSKPHPEPLFAACRQAGLNPAQCVYIGDAAHDISAGKQANMRTLAAAYGYVGEGCQVESWGADGIITHPLQLQNWIQAHL